MLLVDAVCISCRLLTLPRAARACQPPVSGPLCSDSWPPIAFGVITIIEGPSSLPVASGNVQGLPQLQVLDVAGNKLSERHDFRLFALFHLPRLVVGLLFPTN